MNDLRNSLRISDEQAWLATVSLMVLAALALAFVLSYTQSVTLSFVLAIFIATIVSPIVDYQVIRWRVPHAIAVAFAVIAAILLIGVLFYGIVWSATKIKATADAQSAAVNAIIVDPLFDKLADYNIKIEKGKIANELFEVLPSLASQILNKSIALMTFTFFVLIFVMFLLAGRDPYAVKKKGLYEEIEKKIRSYINTKLLVSLVTGVLVWLSLKLLGMTDLAEVFGLLAFILNFIPSVGSVISTLLPIPLAIVQFYALDGDGNALYAHPNWRIAGVLFIPGTIQMVIGNVVEPKMIGEGLQLHPITVVMDLAFWGFIWGPVGTLLAVPMTAVLKIVLLRFETSRPIGELLGGKLPSSLDEPQAIA